MFNNSLFNEIIAVWLQKRLSPFYKEMPLAEYEFLMGGQKKLTIDDLHALLDGNEITGFDPVEEAFKVRSNKTKEKSSVFFFHLTWA